MRSPRRSPSPTAPSSCATAQDCLGVIVLRRRGLAELPMSARRASSPVGSTARASATAKARWAAVSSATATPEIATFAAVLSASGPTPVRSRSRPPFQHGTSRRAPSRSWHLSRSNRRTSREATAFHGVARSDVLCRANRGCPARPAGARKVVGTSPAACRRGWDPPAGVGQRLGEGDDVAVERQLGGAHARRRGRHHGRRAALEVAHVPV
jgi:hypothetical protein